MRIKRKKTRKKRDWKSIIIMGLIGGSLGIGLGIFSEIYFSSGILKGDSTMISLLNFYIYLIIFLFGYLLHIIIHEGGHLIFGLLSGYKFVSFRIASYTLIREDGKLRIKRYNLPGTAGQCLLMPPEIENGKYPFLIYNLGGGLLNLIVSLVGLYVGMKIQDRIFLKALLVFTSIGGLIAGLTNLIPLKIGGIANDGHNILSAFKDEGAREALHKQLWVNGKLSQGERIKDMDKEIFNLDKEADLSSPLNTSVIFMRHNYYLDRKDFKAARESLDLLLPYRDKIIDIYRFELDLERIFLELMGDMDKDFIDRLYNKSLRKYIRAGKYMIGKKRFNMAYEGLYNKDREKALEYYEELLELYNKYPNKGEAEMELMLANMIKEKLEI